jgi:hypothetical protein
MGDRFPDPGAHPLPAGYDVLGNAGSQLITRLYMDFQRMEGEFNFLAWLPPETRMGDSRQAAGQKNCHSACRHCLNGLTLIIHSYAGDDHVADTTSNNNNTGASGYKP